MKSIICGLFFGRVVVKKIPIMKKFILSFLFVACLIPAALSQDTVRYGDPWYAFNPLPNLIEPSPILNIYEITRDPNEEYRTYLGYKDSNYTIYGIAIVMDSFPRPEIGYFVTLLRGMDWHPLGYGQISIDSLYQEDTIKTWTDPLVKRCWFEYFYNYDSATETYKSVDAYNCYEFYFDSPFKLEGRGKNNTADTFFVGMYSLEHTRTFISADEEHSIMPKEYVSYPPTTPILSVIKRDGVIVGGYYERPDMRPSWDWLYWGGIFPIIERRCSVPRGLALSADSLSAHWRSDTDARLFQLAVCTNTVEPDDGLLFTTSATSQVLPPFHRDSTYRLYLRKMCDFRQDSVWSDWSAPLLIASQPTEGISEVEKAGWTIEINPNPATKQVHVTTNFNLTQVEVFDEQGRQCHTLPASGLKADLDVSSWPRGTYLLRISTPAGPTTKKKLLVQ